MQKPRVLSPSLDLEMSGEKLMHDTLHIPDGIDAIFDTIVAQVAENLAGEDASRMKLVVLSGVGDIYHASLSTERSTETRLRRWSSRNVHQVCDGGARWRSRYLETVACAISRPSFWSSP
jgi:hypothetical protein